METVDFSQFSGINSIFSLIGLFVVYFATEIFKWRKKRNISNSSKMDIVNTVNDISRHLKRLEFLQMIHHSPNEKETITKLYDECKELKLNGYITIEYQKWLKTID
jgi:hypothetical protein